MIFDDDILIHHVMIPGMDGNGMTPAEYAQLRSDADDILARPNITGVMAIPGVSGSPTVGDVLVHIGDDQWEPQELSPGISIVFSSGVISNVASTLDFHSGSFNVTASGSGGTVFIEPRYAGSGAARTLARSDHEHQLRLDAALPFDETGTLSSGTRTLISGNVTGLDPSRTYMLSGELKGDLRGGGDGAGYTLPRITMAGNARDRFGGSRGEVRTVSGVDRPYEMNHPGVTVSGVTSASVSASIAYRSGDPINVGAGELTIKIKANR